MDERIAPADGGPDLVAFMSFAVMRGFGAQHALIALADRLEREHRVGLGPLTTFYAAGPEDSEDREKLELAWQEAGPLVESLEATIRAIGVDAQCQALVRRAEAPGLAEQMQSLVAPLQAAATENARVRMVYEL